jgi:hypothetical protein
MMKTMLATRQLGTSDLHITAVGFGARAIGGGNWKYGWGDQRKTFTSYSLPVYPAHHECSFYPI